MSKKQNPPTEEPLLFESSYNTLKQVLGGDTRKQIIKYLLRKSSPHKALSKLRNGMRSDQFSTEREVVRLKKLVQKLDHRTRRDGFHVLNDWDGKADKLNSETIPVDVADYLLAHKSTTINEQMLAIVLDYYFFYLLTLMSLRSWDTSPNKSIEQLNHLLTNLQSSNGSGQKFVQNAETLVLIATSHFEPDETAYTHLLNKVRTWNEPHRLNIALAHAAILGSHLRFGFEVSYGGDLSELRADNIPDYPWLCFAAATLTNTYSDLLKKKAEEKDRQIVVEGILNTLTPDPRAFFESIPVSLKPHNEERKQIAQFIGKQSHSLFNDCRNHRPSREKYSPISFFFNFPHNILKGIVVHSLLVGKASQMTLNDLLTSSTIKDQSNESKTKMAHILMGYARSNPDTIRGRPTPAVIYDPGIALRFFVRTMGIIKKQGLH